MTFVTLGLQFRRAYANTEQVTGLIVQHNKRQPYPADRWRAALAKRVTQGETRFASGTVYTDKPFTRRVETGQRQITGLGFFAA